jgi:hypothetical protein
MEWVLVLCVREEQEVFLTTTVWTMPCCSGNLLTSVLGRGLHADPLLHEFKNIRREVVFAYIGRAGTMNTQKKHQQHQDPQDPPHFTKSFKKP